MRILAFRKVAVDELSRSRIESCLDTEQLERWLGNAMTAEHIEDLFK
ncbi:hypothetical protein [Glycomyces xiaoerkulensis]|nr:hypothetical protein [Glycomyces xiaoerkulensis]